MEAVVAEVLSLCQAAAVNGGALEDLEGRIYAEFADQPIDHSVDPPILILEPLEAIPRDACIGSGWVVYDMGVLAQVATSIDFRQDLALAKARAQVEPLQAGLERVFRDVRGRTTAGHPQGVWHHLSWVPLGEVVSTLDRGPASLQGIEVYAKGLLLSCVFARYREAA